VWSALRRVPAPPSVAWTTELIDPRVGAVRLTGQLSVPAASQTLVVMVHGLGGSAERGYVRRAARAAHAENVASLRLNLRGADFSGDDIHHAGLVEDLVATLASPDLDRFERIGLLGFSLGGHVCLRYAALDPDPRVRAVAALCSPIDLATAADAFDSAPISVYRPHVLGALRKIHAATADRGRAFVSAAATRAVRRIREWDELVITSRFGFASAGEYYRTMSVAPLLGSLKVPALYVGSERDPMVPKAAVSGFLARAPSLDVRWLRRGGHIGFPSDAALEGVEHARDSGAGIDRAVVRWLVRISDGSARTP
jgi:predicted alpha/beta-fold hydrolase